MSAQGVIDHSIEGFEIALPTGPALELVPSTSETDDLQYFTVAYGAGTFVVGASSPEAAAEIGRLERMEIQPENALALAMPIADDQLKRMAKIHNDNIPRLIEITNPRHHTPYIPKHTKPRHPYYPQQGQLFSWITHGGTGETIYRYPEDQQQ